MGCDIPVAVLHPVVVPDAVFGVDSLAVVGVGFLVVAGGFVICDLLVCVCVLVCCVVCIRWHFPGSVPHL